MEHIIEKDADLVFEHYPAKVKPQMQKLRRLLIKVAKETEGVDKLLETLKWGEPSYIVKGGSTVRIDWKERAQDQYAIYFNCQTSLVETFKHLYTDIFEFEGRRAIILRLDSQPNEEAIAHCISLAYQYHKLKNLHLLGV